ncbi:hypothetical protein B0H17DRAFT_1127853 [Mycena rosella]|uniref:Protein kinase domain-containing protein n=1 Tax=Mycena rosella TaxID=1033263 RepID=A0AAD7GR91_MYCRO|nr:hypothetical protein B0H17DRAFT_1127853 [Mycena rosella]
MKRGFLNKPPKSSASQPPATQNDASTKPAHESQPPDSEPEEDTEPEVKEGNELAFDAHRPPQWMLDKHLKNDKGDTRFIFREWPRDPDGKDALQMEQGKMAPNGIIYWGATLYDFYYFRPMPSCKAYIMTSTGSRLATTMRKLGELDAAAPEIEWADMEEAPRQLVLPIEISRDIQPMERIAGGSIWSLAMDGAGCQSLRGTEDARATEVPLQDSNPDAHCDIASITSENYPGPWPTVPFSCVKPPLPKLETLIPYTLLPKKLIVHDPWDLLSMPDELKEDADTDWTKRPDITRTYELEPLTEAGLRKSEHQHEVFRSHIDDSALIMPSSQPEVDPDFRDATEVQCPPWLRIKIPPYPHKTATPAAHLYISPASKAGVGNHSAVYHAEWELPRSLLVPDVFCQQCVAQEIAEMQASGELDQIIAEVTAKERPGHITQKIEIIPELVLDLSERSRRPGWKDENVKSDIRIVQPGTIERTRTYDGPFVNIQTKVQWQTPGRGKNCAHIRPGSASDDRECTRPPTATVRVCAKLSIQNDRHLECEAKVYQAFPAHFSEHWSGYNLVRPSRAPVPVGAVVPQYYGYYVPAASERGNGAGYLSPIMLLENCGTPLDAQALSADEKTECWSLLYRMHHGDWIHESVAARNIVMQDGPLTAPQGWMRGWPGDRNPISFRVIDFGRSRYCGPAGEEGSKDVYGELRAEGNVGERIRYERNAVDRLLEQGYN